MTSVTTQKHDEEPKHISHPNSRGYISYETRLVAIDKLNASNLGYYDVGDFLSSVDAVARYLHDGTLSGDTIEE